MTYWKLSGILMNRNQLWPRNVSIDSFNVSKIWLPVIERNSGFLQVNFMDDLVYCYGPYISIESNKSLNLLLHICDVANETRDRLHIRLQEFSNHKSLNWHSMRKPTMRIVAKGPCSSAEAYTAVECLSNKASSLLMSLLYPCTSSPVGSTCD